MSISIGLLVSAFFVALLHTAIPSHWLCFVLVGRARGWSPRKTMAVAGGTGALHVAMTVSLGLLFAWGESKVLRPEDLERVGGWTLIAIGALYLFLHLTHGGHHHEREASASDRVALAALVFAVTISPCSLAIPILVTAAATSVAQVVLITLVLLATTVGNMVMLVGLTGLGADRIPFAFFDHYEKLMLGFVLAAVGAFLLVAHGHDHESRVEGRGSRGEVRRVASHRSRVTGREVPVTRDGRPVTSFFDSRPLTLDPRPVG